MFNLNSEELFEDEVLKEDQKIIIQNHGTIVIQNIEKKKEDDLEDESNELLQTPEETSDEEIISPDDNPYEDEISQSGINTSTPPVQGDLETSEEIPESPIVEPSYEDESPEQLNSIVPNIPDSPEVPTETPLETPEIPEEDNGIPYDDENNTPVDSGVQEENPENAPEVSDIIPEELGTQEDNSLTSYEDEDVIPAEAQSFIPGAEENSTQENLPTDNQFYEDQPQEELNPALGEDDVDPNALPMDPTAVPDENPYEDEIPPQDSEQPLVDPGMIPPPKPIGIDSASGIPVTDPNEIVASNMAAAVSAGEPLGTPTTITPPVKSDDLKRLYELKSIHEKLIGVKKILNNESHPFFDKLRDKVLDAYEYFSTVIKNLDGYTDTIDDIIIKYKNFIFLVLEETDKYKKKFDKENEENSNKDNKKKDDENSLNTSYKDKDNFYEDEKPKQENNSSSNQKFKRKKGY